MSRVLFTFAAICAAVVFASSSASAFDGYYGPSRGISPYSQPSRGFAVQSGYNAHGNGYAVQGQFGGPRYSTHGTFNRQPVYQQNFRGQNFRGQGGRVHRQYHDTTHYDFQPATATRHGNHLHVQPAHYDLHRTGHVDSHRH